jgi:hypothetical protein
MMHQWGYCYCPFPHIAETISRSSLHIEHFCFFLTISSVVRVKISRRFKGTNRLHSQDRRVSLATIQFEVGSKERCLQVLTH